jgi:hypothetical protein
MIGQSTASFHSRKSKQLRDALKESLRHGIAITGNAPKSLLEKLAAELAAEKAQKESK